MNFLDIAHSRYTTKKYNPNKKISDKDIEQLKEILRMSPSSINSQPWRFTIISDPKLKNELADVSFFNQHKVQDASHLVVFNVIDNLDVFEQQIKENLPEAAYGYYTQHLKNEPEADIKIWMAKQVYLSLGFFLSACASMNIDSTTMEGINIAEYARILGQTDYKPLFAVAIGYRNEEDENQPSKTPKTRLKLEDVVKSI